MASVNKVTLLGNCGKDAEIRYLPSGQAVANVSIATTSRRKDKNTGETIEDTQWHRVTFYERLAEIAGEYVKKGQPIYIEGRLKYGKYTDQSGVEKQTTEIVATEMQLLGKRDGGTGSDGGGGSGEEQRQPSSAPRSFQQRPAPAHAPAPRPALPVQQRPATAAAASMAYADDPDDDVPFLTQSMHFDMTTSKARKMAKYDF